MFEINKNTLRKVKMFEGKQKYFKESKKNCRNKNI